MKSHRATGKNFTPVSGIDVALSMKEERERRAAEEAKVAVNKEAEADKAEVAGKVDFAKVKAARHFFATEFASVKASSGMKSNYI